MRSPSEFVCNSVYKSTGCQWIDSYLSRSHCRGVMYTVHCLAHSRVRNLLLRLLDSFQKILAILSDGRGVVCTLKGIGRSKTWHATAKMQLSKNFQQGKLTQPNDVPTARLQQTPRRCKNKKCLLIDGIELEHQHRSPRRMSIVSMKESRFWISNYFSEDQSILEWCYSLLKW